VGFNSGDNCDKVNQDSLIVKMNFGGEKGMSLFGVMDGHGEDGH